MYSNVLPGQSVVPEAMSYCLECWIFKVKTVHLSPPVHAWAMQTSPLNFLCSLMVCHHQIALLRANLSIALARSPFAASLCSLYLAKACSVLFGQLQALSPVLGRYWRLVSSACWLKTVEAMLIEFYVPVIDAQTFEQKSTVSASGRAFALSLQHHTPALSADLSMSLSWPCTCRQCTSNYPGATWKCMLPMYNWAFLPAPLINHEYLYDTGNLAEDNAQPSNYESFRTLMTASFNLGGPGVGVQSLTSNSAALGVINGRPTAVAPGKPTPYNSTTLPGGGGPVGYKPTIANQQASTLNIYAEACFLHTTVDTAQFTESQVNGVNFNQALWQWFMDDNTLVQEVDTVAGQRTSDDCSSTFTGMLVLAGR